MEETMKNQEAEMRSHTGLAIYSRGLSRDDLKVIVTFAERFDKDVVVRASKGENNVSGEAGLQTEITDRF